MDSLEEICLNLALRFGDCGRDPIPAASIYFDLLKGARKWGRPPTGSYLIRYLRNRRIDRWRSRRRGGIEYIPLEQCPPERAAVDAVLPALLGDEINTLLAACDARERSVIWATFFDGLLLRELSLVWGVSEARACGIRQRALAKMREAMRPTRYKSELTHRPHCP